MRLWLLRRTDTCCIYDANEGFVVRAEDSASARQYAEEECCDEGRGTWLSEVNSSCIELRAEGVPGVVIKDFLAG